MRPIVRWAALVIAAASTCVAQEGRKLYSPVELESIEQEALRLVNAYREREGLSTLVASPELTGLARGHSDRMASGERPMGHAGFAERLAEFARATAYRIAAENIAQSWPKEDPALEVVRLWLGSEKHRTNIGKDTRLTGIGVRQAPDGRIFWTQMFVQPKVVVASR